VTEDDAGALLQARTLRVTLVFEALYAEREHARLSDGSRTLEFEIQPKKFWAPTGRTVSPCSASGAQPISGSPRATTEQSLNSSQA
jgi:hypothetical protein